MTPLLKSIESITSLSAFYVDLARQINLCAIPAIPAMDREGALSEQRWRKCGKL
jgi:hypothetical protein